MSFMFRCREHFSIPLSIMILVSIPAIISTPGYSYASSITESSGQIAFASALDGDSEIYLMDSDGTDRKQLTDNDGYDSFPSWSPDGNKIAFSSGDELYIMNADGTGQERLRNNGVGGFWPSWSPDGSKIAFLSIRNGTRDLYVINADGTNETKLTNEPFDESSPTWSPDSRMIAFAREGEIFALDIFSKNETNLTSNPYSDSYPAWSPDGKKIAFVSGRGQGHLDIYVMNADGSNQTKLMDNGKNNIELGWSQKGDKIIFVSVGKYDFDIFVMDSDGTDSVDLSNSRGSDRLPVFQPASHLPDNGSIVYTRTRGDQGITQIYKINLNGTNATRLSGNLSIAYSYPSWSPDGTKILFESVRSGESDIFVMDEDGHNETKVLPSSLFDTQPSWSPDGSKIVYAASINGKDKDLFVINADGSDQKFLTGMAGDDSYPCFSPDGSRVVFSHFDFDNYEIYVIDVDGSNTANLTHSPGNDSYPSWSPDGSKIVFESTRDNNSEIYAIDPDGTDLKRITNNSAADFSPRWSADGTKITFASTRDGDDSEIYVMDSDGSNVQRITKDSYFESQPHFGAASRDSKFQPILVPLEQKLVPTSPESNSDSMPLQVSEIRIYGYDKKDISDYHTDKFPVSIIHKGTEIVVNGLVQNQNHTAEHFDYITEVIDGEGHVAYLHVRYGVAVPLDVQMGIDSESLSPIVLDKAGTYTVKVFTWYDIDGTPTALSEGLSASIVIQE